MLFETIDGNESYESYETFHTSADNLINDLVIEFNIYHHHINYKLDF